jgi:hypothetical protein
MALILALTISLKRVNIPMTILLWLIVALVKVKQEVCQKVYISGNVAIPKG